MRKLPKQTRQARRRILRIVDSGIPMSKMRARDVRYARSLVKLGLLAPLNGINGAPWGFVRKLGPRHLTASTDWYRGYRYVLRQCRLTGDTSIIAGCQTWRTMRDARKHYSSARQYVHDHGWGMYGINWAETASRCSAGNEALDALEAWAKKRGMKI